MTYSYSHPRPAITTDAVIFSIDADDQLHILLIQRKNEPFKDQWALPGGFVNMDETLEECVAREVKEETGLEGIRFYQLEAFSTVDRDPRDRIITMAFWGFCDDCHHTNPASDAVDARWFDLAHLPAVAFDHEKIIKKALKRALEIMAA